MVGGEAGQGVQTVGLVLARVLARSGWWVFADQDYESRIRGGHNFFRVRAREGPVHAHSEALDLLIALDRNSIDLHQSEVAPGGIILCDGEKLKLEQQPPNTLSVPLERLAREAVSNPLMANTVAMGAALGVSGYDIGLLEDVLEGHFAASGTEVVQANVQAARAGYHYVTSELKVRTRQQLTPRGKAGRLLLTGNEALALGALAAGCRFMASYPMTPSTSIMEYMASKGPELGVAVLHAEDEISAMNMVVGAAFAGVRAMAATSGGGFCLMVEALGLAGITETPVVVVEAQRPGPATGLPTRYGQEDLEFVLHAAQGEFPRAVLAPATAEEAFYLTAHAFNLSERYQTPVIVLSDHYLASSYTTVEPFDLNQVKIERGALIPLGVDPLPDYRRHRLTPDGISPRAIPSHPGTLVVTTGDEHDEEGHITEDAGLRTRMMLKRLGKLEGMRGEALPPQVYGTSRPQVTLLGWGSTYGPLREAVDLLDAGGMAARLVHLSQPWPLPAQLTGMLSDSEGLVVVEQNATGQMAHLLRAETGIAARGHIRRFDGRPMSPAFIATRLKEEMARW
ncbi:MAG: 2-oxoacid:acceptor oxidoreductase subunit alpha [Dehalococcoidia bacterium]